MFQCCDVSPPAEYPPALAFGYFETLLRLGDVPKIRAELARLKGCNETMLEASGFDVGMCEDFTDVTFEMLEAMISSLPNHEGGASLLASFNDDSISAAVTYHFRVRAAFRALLFR